MAVSGSFNFKQNRDDMIKDSLVTGGVIRDDEVPTGTMNASASRLLNRMLQAYSAYGLQLWVHKDAILFTEANKRLYRLSPSGDRWVIKNDAVETKLNGAVAASGTTLVLDTTTNMAVADVIGIAVADNVMHWDTISSITNSTTLVLTTGLSAAAVDDAYVIAYTTKAPKPLRIIDGYILRYAQETNKVPADIRSKNEYYSLSPGYNASAPLTIVFTPEVNDSIIELWPTPDTSNHRVVVRAHFPFDDMDNSNDDFQFPTYWYDAIHYNLAYRLRCDYGIREMDDTYDTNSKKLEKLATNSLQLALDFDVENTYLQIEPEYQWLQGH